jgi:hypothetical protein
MSSGPEKNALFSYERKVPQLALTRDDRASGTAEGHVFSEGRVFSKDEKNVVPGRRNSIRTVL